MADTTFYDKDYLSRSWRMFTQEKGWIKVVLLCALANLVPIIGPIAVTGYVYEWARCTAWGLDSAPKKKDVKIGECIKAGWRVFVAQLGLGIILAFVVWLVQSVLGAIFGGGALAFITTLAVLVVQLAGQLFILVAALRTAIYQKIGAGFGFKHVWEMCRKDVEGLGRILGLSIVGMAISGLVVAVVMALLLATLAPVIAKIFYLLMYGGSSYYYYGNQYAQVLDYVMSAIGGMGFTFVIVAYVLSLVPMAFNFIVTNASALWMRQFNVPAWGDQHAPVPEQVSPVRPTFDEVEGLPAAGAAGAAGAAPAPVAPVAPGAATVAPAEKPLSPQEQLEEEAGEGKVSDLDPTPASEDDIYKTAAEDITAWTSEVGDEHAVDHMEYKDQPTVAPVEQGEARDAATNEELYGPASEAVAEWPEVDLESSNALEREEEAAKVGEEAVEAAAHYDHSQAALEEAAGEGAIRDLHPTVPSESDIYQDAAEDITHWESRVGDEEPVDHMRYVEKATVAPTPQDDAGAPTNEEIYGEADVEVAAWPENNLDDGEVVAQEQELEDELKEIDPTKE
jgi:hypothetical protein